MGKLSMDVRYALRSLRKDPVFALISILVLSLGIGATTSIFTVLNAALLRPLPYHEPDRLVAVSSLVQRGGARRAFPTVSLNEVEQWRAHSASLESIGSFVFTALPVNVNSEALFLVAIAADPELLDTLGVRPAMGSNLAGSGSRQKSASVVISHRLWAGAFHGDPQVIGRTILMNGQSVVVTGVLPATFQFPRADASYFPEEPDLIQPVANIADSWGRDSTQWFAIGRLRPGVSEMASESELRALTVQMASGEPALREVSVAVARLDAETVRSVRPALLLSIGIALVLLLIACANIMNLLFSRAARRGHEMAVRQALGATGWRLTRQMLTESACLTFIAGAVGVMLARVSLDSLLALLPANLPVSGQIEVDWRVLSFALVVCAAASVVSGVVPAVYRSGRTDALVTAARGASESRAVLRFQGGLMVAQIALGVSLLAAAGLLAHSLARLSSVDPGFRTADTVGFEVAFPSGNRAETPRRHERILEAVRNTPGVVSAGWITNLPPETRAGVFIPFSIPGTTPRSRPMCNFQSTSDGYFLSAGIALTRGRDFTAGDAAGAQPVAIVNEALARQYFPNSDPIGRRILTMWDGRTEREIVGVIRDIHDRGLGAKTGPTVFVPYRQFSLGYGAVVARTSVPAASILPALRRQVAGAEPDVPVKNLGSLEARLDRTLAGPRFYATMAVACGGMALLFVTLGLYGVISHAVARRTREIGIRVALGAPRHGIVAGVLRRAFAIAISGVALGLGLSLAGTRLLRTLLFEVQPVDPATLAVAAVLAMAVTLAASYIPARRASRVDPVVALRCD